jgi:hypothetical protein
MPVGDSITFGVDVTVGYDVTEGGYRTYLFGLAHDDEKDITFVGSQSDGPDTFDGLAFPKNHEGHRGWVIQQIDGIIEGVLSEHDPDIVTLMIGTNDINSGGYTVEAGQRFDALLDRITTAKPECLVVVAKLTPAESSGENEQLEHYSSDIAAVVSARAEAGQHVLLVDM